LREILFISRDDDESELVAEVKELPALEQMKKPRQLSKEEEEGLVLVQEGKIEVNAKFLF
jgi:hypothetical protein